MSISHLPAHLGQNLALDTVNYSLAAQDVTFELAHNLGLDSVSYAWTLEDATLTYAPGGVLPAV